ncbi:MAG: hypothetical protein OTJ44_00845 [Planctomycetota bacterium]|nr:hypothetical protein [Planctomycetota bacterium]
MITTLPLLLMAIPQVSPGQAFQDNQPTSTQVQEELGNGWRLRWDDSRQAARFLFGAKREAFFAPHSDIEWEDLARMELDALFDWFQIQDSTLVFEETLFLNLENAGTTNKQVVTLRQEVNGVPVLGSWVSALFTPTGNLLALDSQALPNVRISTKPLVDSWTAVAAAADAFRELGGRQPEDIGKPELIIFPSKDGGITTPRLSWMMDLRAESSTQPFSLKIFVAADDASAEILESQNLIHHQSGPNDLSGHVDAWATPGSSADSNGNPEQLFPMAYMKVTSSAGNTETDASGNFNISYTGSSNVNVTFEYYGDFANVVNNAGSDYTLSQSFAPGTPANAAMNPSKGEQATSQANSYKCIIDFREWTRATNANDGKMDFRVKANVNINDTCNAYYNGSSINFYKSGGGCANTAFSTIVAHEEGHWANDRYSSGNGSDGFGEGNADVYAMYIYDTPFVGEGFSSFGGIRNGENTRQFCGDSNGGCWGGVHADGEVLMGALWKVRRNLNQSLGNQTGDTVSSVLHNAWMNGYNDSKIRTYIEDHWLALDDDDGLLDNGTPNYSDIDGGFREQGFPGVTLNLVDVSHTPVADTTNEAGPYNVIADLDPVAGTSIASAIVEYDVDGNGPISVGMSNIGGINWAASIPGQASPSVVTYHMLITNSDGNDYRYPTTGEIRFLIGDKVLLYFNDFEGASDESWTHVQQNTEDDWQRGNPVGDAEDPSSAYSGTNVWGNDLGVGTSWNGKYKSNAKNYLRSPEIDTTGFDRVFVEYARWLAIDHSFNDIAQVRANGDLAWENPNDNAQIDTAWSIQTHDISSASADRVDAKIRWTLDANGSNNYGGWNIDDVKVIGLKAVSGNTDRLNLGGTTQASAGGSGNWTVSGATPNRTVYLLWSLSNAGTSIMGHPFDLGTPWTVGSQQSANTVGLASFTATLPSNTSGLTIYLEAGALDATGAVLDSNLLTLQVQ